MRRLLSLASVSLLLLVACADQPSPSAGPTSPRLEADNAVAACPNADSVRALIRGMYAPGNRLNQVNTAYTAILQRLQMGWVPSAQELTLNLVKSVLADFYGGVLIGGQNEATRRVLAAFINGVFCQVGLPAPNLDFISLGPDAVVGVVGPSFPMTTLVTQTQFAGLQVPTGSAPQVALVMVRRLPDQPSPLLTPLDQYPAFYEYTASPAVTFSQDVLVGVCQAADFTPPDFGRLKVAHNVGSSAVLLPRVVAPFINCTNLLGAAPFYPGLKGYASRTWHWMLQATLPQPAYASALGTCCLGGTTKTFSPFGAVDTLLLLEAVPPQALTGAPGSSVPVNDRPAVKLRTPSGKPAAGLTVTFTLASTSDGSISGATAVTNANGLAELSGWILGTDLTPDSVIATVTPIPGTGVQGNGPSFVATPAVP